MEDSNFRGEVPNLFHLKKKNIYQIPDGFFEDLEKSIRYKRTRNPGVVRNLKKWVELSVAAVLVGFMLFSGVKIIAEKKYVPVETDRTIYNITDGDMDQSVVQINPSPKN